MGFKTALVSMPFVDVNRPSIQLGLLSSILAERGFACSPLHLYLEFAKDIGVALYRAISHYRGIQLGEWLFAKEAFESQCPPGSSDFLEQFSDKLNPILKESVPLLKTIRDSIAPQFLDRMLQETDWGAFSVIGFTSTFQQNVASFAFARKIKKRHPQIKILFGGANFDGEMGMEWMRAMPFIDFAISGEADDALPALIHNLCENIPVDGVSGLIFREADGLPRLSPVSAPSPDLEKHPTPDYLEYFERLERLELDMVSAAGSLIIPFESARGCWWGQKQHCTFCGLNGASMRFRSKRPAQVVNELQEQAQRFGVFNFAAVDNIMDVKYFGSFLDLLAESQSNYTLFYELKSNITRDQIKRLADAGVARIQPGIESLDTSILTLMRKGVRGIQNVNLLRWAMYFGVNVSWNLLWGFPGETCQAYERQLQWARCLTHLQPPGSAGRIHIDRFSPLFENRSNFPALWHRPEASYGQVYPTTVNLERAAYFFDSELCDVLKDSSFAETLLFVQQWKDAWRRPAKPFMKFWYTRRRLRLVDHRFGRVETVTLVDDLADIYFAASTAPISAAGIKTALPDLSSDVEQSLEALCEAKLMIKEEASFLSLAIPAKAINS